ncbi:MULTISPECIES: hypothetical protein [unclassified Mucilaginibacter]|uniref:hypothetical protein n=1 Tax=unclassified Mucilaginibacter TaxID=2617802 RepID=UPI0031F7012C
MSKRILIVDEDLIELNQLSLMLDSRGYEVCPLHQSYKILNEISRCKPDFILMDTMFSEMDSMVVSRALGVIETVKDIPLMLILGKDYNHYTYSLKPYGNANGNSVKTTDLDTLIENINLRLAS